MNKRTSYTKNIKIHSVTISSIFEIGDSSHFTPEANVLAVQKEGGVESDVFPFEKYDIFDRKYTHYPIKRIVNQHVHHHKKNIHVNNVDILGVSTSSLAQIGSLNHIDANARIKHIRILEE
ncbi:spore germination protein GerPE [Aquibacillus albus]|uniref:Spore germination protein PE n=1 Tax=Aquibacillus albus TaxID=1168171 RepID=A0ABS2N009_9BACI|nr:spore germination protein GerPE [Aquibacillus albus]MBM7571494.1 spore germination protein PE [Aquibacillus albus]